MSYDLSFWKYDDTKKSKHTYNHQMIYESCSNGDLVDGLQDLPIADILDIIDKAFANYRTEINTEYHSPEQNWLIEIMTTQQFIRFDCSNVNSDDMNKLIDIMDKFDCPLYNPQVPKRFD